jgi:hypothetical protein
MGSVRSVGSSDPTAVTGFFERVLRSDEQTGVVARYILENPVRAGLAATLLEYPYSGSSTYSREHLAALWEGHVGPV